MSFILNALRKSEQERQSAQAKTLGDRVLEKQAVEKKKNKSFWWLILVIANVFFMVYFLIIFGDGGEEKTEKSLPIPESAEVKKIADQQVGKMHLNEKGEQSSIAVLLNNQRVENQKILKKKMQQARDAEQVEQEKRVEEKIKAVKNTKKISPVIRPKLIAKTVPIKKPVVTNRAPVVKPKPRVVVKKEAGPPFLSELSYDFRRTVPRMRINVFVYSDNKEERFIMVDMKKYQSGQEISEGLELKEIQPDSLVVEYDGRVFRIKH
jgi:general secretion pathway protein B